MYYTLQSGCVVHLCGVAAITTMKTSHVIRELIVANAPHFELLERNITLHCPVGCHSRCTVTLAIHNIMDLSQATLASYIILESSVLRARWGVEIC